MENKPNNMTTLVNTNQEESNVKVSAFCANTYTAPPWTCTGAYSSPPGGIISTGEELEILI